MARLSLLLLTLAIAVHQALAHGGGLHPWDFTYPGYSNYTKMLLGSATGFRYYNTANSTLTPGPIPVYVSNTSAVANVTGTVQLWQYLDANCRDTHTLIVNLTFTTAAGRPINGSKVYGYGMTGTCAGGVTDLYRNNATLGDNRLNLVWWGRGNEGFTNTTGLLFGSAPNTFFPRRNATAAGPALRSILLAPNPADSAFLCADLVWVNYDLAAWNQSIAACVPNANGPAHRRMLRHRRLVAPAL